MVLRLVAQTLQQRALERLELEIVRGSEEVQQAEAVDVRLVGRRRDDAVDARFEVAGCPELEDVGDVDGDGFGVWFDLLRCLFLISFNVRDCIWSAAHPFPTPIRHPNLQRRNRLPKQQRQRPKVRMSLGVDILIFPVLLRRAVAVDHISKMAVRDIVILMAVGQIILRQLQNNSD